MRGKLRPRVQPRTKDWHDCIVTVCKTGRTVEEVMAMSPGQRKAAKEEAAAETGPSFHGELVKVWNAWRDAPEPKIHNWRQHLESIGRMDLYRDLGIDSPIYYEEQKKEKENGPRKAR